MYGHSLQLQFSLGTKWKALCGARLRREARTPLSVMMMNSSASELTHQSMIADVDPIKSAEASTSCGHSGWAATSAFGCCIRALFRRRAANVAWTMQEPCQM